MGRCTDEQKRKEKEKERLAREKAEGQKSIQKVARNMGSQPQLGTKVHTAKQSGKISPTDKANQRLMQLEERVQKIIENENAKSLRAVVLDVREITEACLRVHMKKANSKALFKFYESPKHELKDKKFYRAKVLIETLTAVMPVPCQLEPDPREEKAQLDRWEREIIKIHMYPTVYGIASDKIPMPSHRQFCRVMLTDSTDHDSGIVIDVEKESVSSKVACFDTNTAELFESAS